MKRRLICLALCLVFVLSACLTGCKKKTTDEMMQNIQNQASEDNVTLTMWMVTEAPLADDVREAVTGAVNRITTSRFNTYMVINFLTEDEYRDTLTEEIQQNEDERNEFSPVKEIFIPQDIIYGVGDANDKTDAFKTRYPGVANHQVDIVYIAGESMYKEYIENGWLAALDSELSGASKKINETISATLLRAAKVNNATYAIPNNKAIGEYTFMLLNKELADKTSLDGIYELGEIDGFFNDHIHHYLEEIYRNQDEFSNVTLIDGSYEDCKDLLAHYWSINPDTYEAENRSLSVLGYRYTNPKTLSKGNTILSFDSLFADEVFCENLIRLNEYESNDFFGTPTADQKAAIKFAEGSLVDYERYLNGDEYYPVIVKYPTVDVEDVYESMFGVCTYTANLTKSMQILTYLNTNADLRNIIQYGVEGEHYNLLGNGTVERVTDENGTALYSMDILKTGNTFVAYPGPDDMNEMSENVWEMSKKQNLDALIEPLLNLDFSQIVKDSGKTEDDDMFFDVTRYVYTYSSGYTKEVASEHEYLKKWIDQCDDNTEKGVYVLHTGVVDGQNFTGKIYYYNNNISGAKVTVADSDGAFTVNYEGTVGEGSDVTVINFSGRKDLANPAWNATVNGAAVTTSVSYRNADVTFDFLDTKNYTVDLDTQVTKTMISDNDLVWNWMIEVSKEEDTSKIYMKSYEAEGSYTWIFYLPKIEQKYAATANPVLVGDQLYIDVNYQSNAGLLEEGEDVTYALFILNVDVKAPISVEGLRFAVDGSMEAGNDILVKSGDTVQEDPKIDISGTLDVELVNYFAWINSEVEGLLESCKTPEEYRAMVEALHILFTPITQEQVYKFIANDEEYSPIEYVGPRSFKFKDYVFKEDYSTLPAAFVEFVDKLDGEEFYWMLACATSKDKVDRYGWDYDYANAVITSGRLSSNKKVSEIAAEDDLKESYYSYKSPYALYYNWLRSNKYID